MSMAFFVRRFCHSEARRLAARRRTAADTGRAEESPLQGRDPSASLR
jgi:hypothetical protein